MQHGPIHYQPDNSGNSIQFRGSSCLTSQGEYSTTPTATLQAIEGIIPLHINAEQEVPCVRTARLRITYNYNNINCNPDKYENAITFNKFNPEMFEPEVRISLKKQFLSVPGLSIYMDGSKTYDKTGSAFCVKEEDTMN
ncbi:hypothetical protein AVEN_113725-1 [Araneus ventricosus]|uniref:Uncharacterized protein n=1 Tax=Araneus ventricosus TaxID=182803 RepID=A0A4Y2HWA3_ARAVE|nr:hypothetical protein AVEN_113725-1 [Araneus ventricosus]